LLGFYAFFYLFSMLYSMKILQKHILVLFGFKIRIFLVLSGLYNPETLNLFWPVSGVLMHFWTVLNVEHILFDSTSDL